MRVNYHNRECLVSHLHPPDPSIPRADEADDVDVEDHVCALGGKRTL